MMGLWDGSGISWTICKRSAPRSRQITTPTPHHSIFTGRTLFLMPKQQCQSNEGFSLTSVNYGINSNIRALTLLVGRQTEHPACKH